MPKSRPDKTLADYLVIAVTPALIMLLVGSLVFFLLEISYSGDFTGRLHWILFWFVFATVLISRIAILQGTEYAGAFGLALAAAMALAIFRFVDAPFLALGLLAVVWWCVNKLTWDCTLIDDTEDASGEGLLRVAGLEPAQKSEPAQNGGTDILSVPDGDAEEEKQTIRTSQQRRGWWRSFFEHRPERQGQPHAPGLWVVYFSLAALPLFGLGQLLIPPDEATERRYAFQLLWAYVASALSLLLATSFLGLRRYLRQRRIKMPAAMARGWLALGGGLVVVILLLCLVLPRPNATYSLTAWLDRVGSEARQASRFAMVGGDKAEGEGRRSGEAEKDRSKDQQDQDGKDGQNGNNAGKGESPQQGAKSGEGKAAGQGQQQGRQQASQSDQKQHQSGSAQRNEQAKQAAADKKQPAEQAAKQSGEPSKQADAPQPQPGEWFHQVTQSGWLAQAAKWIVYGLLVLASLYLLVRYWSQIMAALRQFWESLWKLFARQKRSSHRDGEEAAAEAPRQRPFAAYANPFATGAANRMSAVELVQYTFEALEAWASEQGAQRSPHDTPMEFSQLLERRFPHLGNEPLHVARLYAQVAYAGETPPSNRLRHLEQLWRRLSA